MNKNPRASLVSVQNAAEISINSITEAGLEVEAIVLFGWDKGAFDYTCVFNVDGRLVANSHFSESDLRDLQEDVAEYASFYVSNFSDDLCEYFHISSETEESNDNYRSINFQFKGA